MTHLTISIAMCTFNGERFLKAQLESIAAQSRLPDELVICDDNSSDDSARIVAEFAGRVDFPIHFFVNDSNLGSTRNFEKAMGLCHGSIVAVADQDDIWYAHKLASVESAFRNSDATVAVFSDADLIDQDSTPLGLRLWPTFSFDLPKQKAFAKGCALSVLIRHPVVTGATMAFRRKLFELMTPVPANEIHDRWMSFLLAVCGKFEIIPQPLMQYRRHRRQQVGPGPSNLRDQMAHAKGRDTRFYFREMELFHQLYSTLEERRQDFPNADYVLREIGRKLSHLKYRTQLPRSKAFRIPNVVREAVNRNYWRYSGGWRSIGKDLILR